MITEFENPFLQKTETEDVLSEYGLKKEDAPYHPYYYIPQGENVMKDPLYKAIKEVKEERTPKVGQRPENSGIFQNISKQDEINRKELINDWVNEKVVKSSKKGRPKKYTELEIRAIQDVHIEWEFGYKKIAAILSNKALSKRDSKLFIFLLLRAEWTDKDIKKLLHRIYDGESKMSPIQAKRLKEKGMKYLD